MKSGHIMPTQIAKARFIEPMLLQRVSSLPADPEWSYEVKLDGYRALGIKANGKVLLRSRNNKDFNSKYPGVARALAALPDDTVIDGEIVALDSTGRPVGHFPEREGNDALPVSVYLGLDDPSPVEPCARSGPATPDGQRPCRCPLP